MLPSWVPAAGASATYNGGGSVLTNNWRATHDPTAIGYDAFYSAKINAAYSSQVTHQTWRTHGGIVFFGGGHSGTNYNGGHILTLAQSTMYYECLWTPFDWAATLDNGNIESEVNSYGEATGSSPLRVAGPHSYGGDVIDGFYTQAISLAYTYTGSDLIAQAAHEIDLTNPATSYSTRAWVRRTNSVGAWTGTAAPVISRYVASQDRIYMMTRGGGNLKWFDRAANTWITGSNAGWGYDASDTDGGDPKTGALVAVAARNLLLGCYRTSGNLVVQYIDTTLSQPTVATATLDTSLAMPVDGCKAISWCPDNSKLLVFGVTSNLDRCYEITIPATVTNTWTVASAVISGDPFPADNPVGIWGKCDYVTACKVIVIPSPLKDAAGGNDSAWVYRPRNT